MAIASLFQAPRSEPEFAEWSFANMAHHRDIFAAIYRDSGDQLTEYAIDPIDHGNLNLWLYQHQAMHDQQNQVTGIAGYNLTGVDWNDREDLRAWISQHADEHFRIATLLGVS